MKKLFLITLFLQCSLLSTHFSMVKADEGMWTLYNLPEAVYNQMVAEGLQLPYKDLYYGDHAVKNAVVNFSGYCSGVVVSPNGLVFTNHHCGFSAINKHSTVEHDYMLNGFCAKSYEEELPNEDMFVSFMIDQLDVTSRIYPLIEGKSSDEQSAAIDSVAKVMTDSIKAIDKSLHIEIDPFYEGNQYFATTYQEFHDLRLVFTVPKSMGKFGGETDNWMWPRQTCDFSVFRIYADPETNGPAEYSKDNVPYHPKHWAPVSLQGYQEGSYAMTLGYPGSTSRYLSSYGITEMRNGENATRVQVRDKKLAILRKYMDKDERLRILYEDDFASSSNYWKNSIGMNKCIDSIGIVQQKEQYEARIREWQQKQPVLSDRVNVDFDLLQGLYEKRFKAYRALNILFESFWRNTEFFTRAININSSMKGIQVKGPEDNPKKQYLVFDDNSDKWDMALDKELTACMLENFGQQVPEEYLPYFYETIKKKFKGDYTKYVDYLYKKSALMKKGAKIYSGKKDFYKDPGISLGVELLAVYGQIGSELWPLLDSVAVQEKKLCEARIQMEQELPHYSDANFTMRLSYGQVGGYRIGGYDSSYYTTAESIIEKMKKANENAEYFAEPIMHELLSAKDYGKYQDPKTGKMQLCFLTNNDITGGNSGSPMFDGKGRLIGLAFDGNWDSLSSDINFDKELARCIGVDIRFVLYLMDKWGHADRLLQEINAQ